MMNAPTPLHSVSVAGAVYDKETDAFLVIQRQDNNEWQLPGGVLELEETIEQGVVREVLEETGITVRPIKLTGVYKNTSRGIVALVFLCEKQSGSMHQTVEAKRVRWMPASEVSETMTPAFSIRLLDAIKNGTPFIRTNDGINLVD